MSRRKKIKSKFPRNVKLIDRVFDNDPSKGAYGEWMVNTALNTSSKTKDIIAIVNLFHKNKVRLPKEKRDLYSYKTLSDLRSELKKLKPSKSEKKKEPGYVLIGESGHVKMYNVLTHDGIKTLGRGTTWCITQKYHWNNYTKNNQHKFIVAISDFHKNKEKHKFSKFALDLGNENPRHNPYESRDRRLYNTLNDLHFALMNGGPRTGYKPTNWFDTKDVSYNNDYFSEYIDSLADCPGFAQEMIDKTIKEFEQSKDKKQEDEEFKNGKEKLNKLLKKKHIQKFTKKQLIFLVDFADKYNLFNPLSVMMLKPKDKECLEHIWKLATKRDKKSISYHLEDWLIRHGFINYSDIILQHCIDECISLKGARWGTEKRRKLDILRRALCSDYRGPNKKTQETKDKIKKALGHDFVRRYNY